eukprot:6520940-Prymnesium_polylepis.1
MLDGKLMPFLECDEAYKHLGPDDEAGREQRRRQRQAQQQVGGGVSTFTLRRMHWPSGNAFMIYSEGLVNSLVAYYMGTTYISWEEAEKWEARWRRIFNSRFERANSAPRVELYVQVDGQSRVKTHVWFEA